MEKKNQQKKSKINNNFKSDPYILERQLMQLQSMIVNTRSLFATSQQKIALGRERLKITNERLEILNLQIQRSKEMLAALNHMYFKPMNN